MSVAEKIGQTLHEWLKKAEVDSDKRAGVPTQVDDEMKVLEREVRELQQANEILRKASAYFAQGGERLIREMGLAGVIRGKPVTVLHLLSRLGCGIRFAATYS